MERSGWFDDDDDDSPSEPLPSERAWRHPSELGAHGAFEAAVPRRRTGARFVTALTLGTAGSLVLAVLASVHAFGPTGGTATVTGRQSSLVGEGTSFGLGSSTTRLLTVLTTAAPATSTSVAASMPPMVQVRTGDADHTIAAALVDDGSLVTTVDDMGDAKEGEAVLASGETVKVVVERIDADTGVVHLRPATPVEGDDVADPADTGAVWMGVSCGDGREPAPATAPSSVATTEPATTAPVTAEEPTTVVATVPTSADAPTTAPADRPAPTAATAATTAAATSTTAAAVTTTTVASLGVTTTTVATSVPGTTTTTAAATVSGARVLSVFAGSPADGQLLAGDLIVSVNGKAVHSTWALVLAVRQYEVGAALKVGLLRDGVALTRTVTLAPAPGR